MFHDVINRQAFEITCKNESTARRVQHDIESYTAMQFSNIMNEVFSVAGNKDHFLKIDRIEIDLGDIRADDLKNWETASRFKSMLQQIIDGIQKKRTDSRVSTTGDNGTINYNDEPGNALELLRIFLSSGDLPWWADKRQIGDIDSMVKKLLVKQPELFRELLIENSDRPGFLSRLFAHVSPLSYPGIAEIVNEISVEMKENLLKESMQFNVCPHLSNYQKRLREILKAKKKVSVESRREYLMKQLVKLYNTIIINKVCFERTGLANILIQFGMSGMTNSQEIISYRRGNNLKSQTKNEIRLLSIFEVEVLIFVLSPCFDEALNVIYPNALLIENRKQEFIPGENGNGAIEDIKYNGTGSKDRNADKLNEYNLTSQKAIEKEKKWQVKEPQEGMPAKNQEKRLQAPGQEKRFPQIISPEFLTGSQQNKNDKAEESNGLPNDSNESKLIKKELSSGQENDPGLQEPEDLEIENWKHQSKTIDFIIKKLKRDGNPLKQYLLAQRNKRDLDLLRKALKQLSFEKRETEKTINRILKDPSFFKYNILKIFTGLELAKGLATQNENKANAIENKLANPLKNKLFETFQRPVNKASKKIISTDLITIIKQLPTNHFLVVKDVLTKKRFDTGGEQKVFKKILEQLTYPDILFLKYLTELPPAELEKMQPAAEQSHVPLGNTVFKRDEPDKINDSNSIQIENAGLSLLAVYLPGFFRHLGYIQNGEFQNRKLALRAVCLLQYLASGTSKRPEYLLQFNKILCSISPEEVIINNNRLTGKEKQEADQLLVSVIQNWKVLKNTSAKGFRESFLQRKGILSETETSWVLKVEKKGFDILLDSIPWNFNLVKLSWMKKFIQVEW